MMVTGEPPVTGTTTQQILTNIKDGKMSLGSRNAPI